MRWASPPGRARAARRGSAVSRAAPAGRASARSARDRAARTRPSRSASGERADRRSASPSDAARTTPSPPSNLQLTREGRIAGQGTAAGIDEGDAEPRAGDGLLERLDRTRPVRHVAREEHATDTLAGATEL